MTTADKAVDQVIATHAPRCPRPTSGGSGGQVDVLVVTPTFHPEPIGTPYYATDAVRWFTGQGFRVAVVTAMPFYPEFRRYPGYGRKQRVDHLEDVPVHRMPTVIPRGGSTPMRAVSDLNFALQALARQLLNRLPTPRAVLTFSPGTPLALLTGLAAARQGARHVGMVHDLLSGLAGATTNTSAAALRAMRWVECRALDRCDEVLTLSPAMARQVRALGVRAPVGEAPIWVDPHFITPSRPEPAGDKTIVMYSGNLGRKQGVQQLLEVAELLALHRQDVQLVIQGGGALRHGLEQQIVSRQLTNVSLRPLVHKDRLAEQLRGATVHVVPQAGGVGDSAVPSKLFNIMAVGRPAVVGAAPDSAVYDLGRASGAFVVTQPGDAGAMTAALLNVLDDPGGARRMGEAGVDYVAEHHSRDSVMRRITQALGLH